MELVSEKVPKFGSKDKQKQIHTVVATSEQFESSIIIEVQVIRHKSAGIDPAQSASLPRWAPLIAAVNVQMPPHLLQTTRSSPLTPQRSKCPHMSSATPPLHQKDPPPSQFHTCSHF